MSEQDDEQWGIDWSNFRVIDDAPAEARGTGDIPVGTRCQWTEDGVVTWRGEVVEGDGEEWRAVLHRAESADK